MWITSCGLLPTVVPDWVVNRLPLPSCGEEAVGHGEGLDPVARRCLLEALADGRGAELMSTETTIEGDAIARIFRVHENGTIELFVDATRDRFGSGEWERLVCDALTPVADANDPPDLVFPDELVFIEEGCVPHPTP